MKYMLYIFDLDGTLIDSHMAICMALNDVLKAFGLPQKDLAVLKKTIGIPLMTTFEMIGIAIPDKEKAFNMYRDFYFPYIEKYQFSIKNMKETLDELKGRVLLAIATNKGRNGTLISLKAADLDGYFEFMTTENELTNLKPHPESFDKIMQFYHGQGKFLERSDVLMIGDSHVDIDFAHNSGIDSAFVTWGFSTLEELTNQPTYVLSDPTELLEIGGINETVTVETTEELDLHLFQPKEIESLVKDYLLEARQKNMRVVRIIHGKGKGVQREMVQNILKNTPFVKDFYDAPVYIGGYGATIAEIETN
jgi:phosphoglycolate phosphatase